MDFIQYYAENFVRNLKGSVAHLKPEGWIRLIAVVCAYLLLRPYLMGLGARRQRKQHEETAAANAPTGAAVHPNELRSGKKAVTGKKVGIATGGKHQKCVIPSSEGNRGSKARVRQRRVIQELLDNQEKRMGEENLKDIVHLLED
ncbi:hypothetical protein BU23DRAFT_595971 [Bimuria novae-zelandiae CBS 107.79]|uniref:DUF1531-domain-containing protein n=1 Tax=Bimuria novae-zelandiae CBS 107.79 TaxID=1447943 RepID=A0A6A5VKK3_9PLEO|nr:hypothetical protein BU23DRAFT_595971 [Bimuria novae-zelandiae CBS 107.79]